MSDMVSGSQFVVQVVSSVYCADRFLGAVRLEHQFYALGQACANACDIVLEKSVPFQQVPYNELKERLLQQGAILDVGKVGAPTFPGDDDM